MCFEIMFPEILIRIFLQLLSTLSVVPLDQSTIRDGFREAVSESLRVPFSNKTPIPSGPAQVGVSSEDEGECSLVKVILSVLSQRCEKDPELRRTPS